MENGIGRRARAAVGCVIGLIVFAALWTADFSGYQTEWGRVIGIEALASSGGKGLGDGKYAVDVVDGRTYYDQNTDGGNSMFLIPVLAFDEEMPVIADTVAMGAPHEIQYTLHFYSDSIGSESSLPREGAKRVLIMAAVIIIAGGILNYFTNKRRKRDYSGAER